MEKENSSLHLELRSCLKELEIRTLERDLSTKTTENASKQHLESIKRVAKLEAEFHKATSSNDANLIADSQSDGGGRSNECATSNSIVKNEKAPSNTHVTPSIEIGVMDDFLEMEKFAALPMSELDMENELRQAINLELNDANVRREEVESKCKELEDEREVLLSKVSFLEGGAEKERTLHEEASVRCRGLEDEHSGLKYKLDSRESQFTSMIKSKEELEQELLSKTEEIESLESQLKNEKSEANLLLDKIGSLEKEAEREKELVGRV